MHVWFILTYEEIDEPIKQYNRKNITFSILKMDLLKSVKMYRSETQFSFEYMNIT